MKKMIFMLSLWMACNLSYAQDSTNELLKKLVEKNVLTQNEADSLIQKETPKSSLGETVTKVRQAFNTPYIRFGGYGQFIYNYSDVLPVKHSAEPKVVLVSMRGELTKNLKYFVLTEFVNPMVYEFFGEWTPMNEFNVKVGQMKTPLALESQMSLTDIEGILNTRSVSALIGMGDDVQRFQNNKNNTGRDIGALVYGNLFKRSNHDLLQYSVGIFQGTGISTRETNNSKDFAGNVMLQPFKGFRIGGGAYFGEASYLKPGDLIKDDHVRNRWIASSDYRSDRFYGRTEWIQGNDGGIDKEGLHAMALWYLLPKQLNAFGKVDYLNQNKKLTQEVMEYTFGVNYYFYPACRVQLNYIYSDYSKNWKAPNSNMVFGQLQIVF